MELRPGKPDQVGMSAARVRRLAQLAQSWVTQGITPALVVLVARRGVIVLHEAYGCLTPAQDAPPLPLDTLFPLASLTKPITATAAMLLVEQGLLGLNRPVAEYIPEFAGEGKEAVLVRHLLTHTSGLREQDVWQHIETQKLAGAKIPPPAANQHAVLNEYLYLGYNAPLWKPPGVEMSYIDFGYELVGEIVRRVSGQSLSDFAREQIFAPLGMQDTWYCVPDSVGQRIVRRLPNAVWAGPESPGMEEMPAYIQSVFSGLDSREFQELPSGSDGVYSTALDMARFGQMFLNRGAYRDTRLLSPTSVVAMTRNQISGINARFDNEFFPEASWGFGWSVGNHHKQAMYDGTLWSPGAFAHGGAGGVALWVDPVYEIVGVYFSVVPHATADGKHHEWSYDLFLNAVMAAVVDA